MNNKILNLQFPITPEFEIPFTKIIVRITFTDQATFSAINELIQVKYMGIDGREAATEFLSLLHQHASEYKYAVAIICQQLLDILLPAEAANFN